MGVSARPSSLVFLLPARNCADDLPAWFASVRPVADAVVALDDGSTDATAELLEADPLVCKLLRNPRRDSYVGWDDADNRNRLLEAAAALEPAWIMQLDADERLAPDDAAALRAFVEGDALPGLAYGFRLYRMLGDGSRYDPRPIRVYRLFHWQDGQVLPRRRLHGCPIPSDIPRQHWLRTTIRIQHFGGATPQRRLVRYAKYRESDPDNEYQRSYRNLLATPLFERAWEPRCVETPIILGRGVTDPGRPVLSAIVISRDDEQRIERAVRSVVEQQCPEPFEVIVVTSGSDATADIVRRRFPAVTLVALPRPALPGEARNAGLRVARGTYVSFPGSHVELPPGSLAARIRAHRLGFTMVTGSVHNGTLTAAGWASYFLDHATALPGRPSGPLRGAPAHCSYTRAALSEIGGFAAHMRAGEDTVANRELVRRGHKAYRAADIVLVHHSPCRGAFSLLRHHFTRGRWWGRILREDRARGGQGAGQPKSQPPSVRKRVVRTGRNVRQWAPELTRQYRAVLPLLVAGAVAAWCGAWFELLVLPDRMRGGRAGEKQPPDSPYVDLARGAARRHEVPEDLFLALVSQESGWRAEAVSPDGAIGLAQLMPETADNLGVDPWVPADNLEGGARYLRSQFDRFDSWPLALAAYNAGPHRVDQYRGVPPFAETRRYVERVLARATSVPPAAAAQGARASESARDQGWWTAGESNP